MRIAGIISEYNPFHNGHAAQLSMVRKECDGVVTVMSGSFVQRGDVAVYDKWTRAHAALLSGADLVLELPCCYALATAERFAYGAVSLLDQTGVIDRLYFGAETPDTDAFQKAGTLLCCEPPEVSEKLQKALSFGLSFPAARQKAFAGWIPEELLSLPNNLLGLEYCRALFAQKSRIEPHALPRIGADHHQMDASGEIASATQIRSLLKSREDASAYLPNNALPLYQKSEQRSLALIERMLLYRLRTAKPAALLDLADVSEGLENRILSAAKNACSYSELLQAIETKRYPAARIRRILLSFLLGIPGSMQKEPIPYLRILGMNQQGREILRKIKKHSTLSIITKAADYSPNEMFLADCRATDLASLCQKTIQKSRADYLTPPVILD